MTRNIAPVQVLDLAVFMHDTYEHLAKQVGWKTQESCQVRFNDLPAANRKVMLSVAHEVLKRLSTQV